MLSLWVYEARDLLPKKRYFCKLLLDGTLYACTTTKPASPTGAIFWGEHFDLKTLPSAVDLQVCLVQEEEGQRPKGSTIANTAIPLKDLAAVRQPLEKWYPLGKDKHNNVPTLRLRGRYCDIRVLPIVQYKEFAEYLTFHYQELCTGLEHNLNARDKEELTGVLVRVLQSTGKAKVSHCSHMTMPTNGKVLGTVTTGGVSMSLEVTSATTSLSPPNSEPSRLPWPMVCIQLSQSLCYCPGGETWEHLKVCLHRLGFFLSLLCQIYWYCLTANKGWIFLLAAMYPLNEC